MSFMNLFRRFAMAVIGTSISLTLMIPTADAQSRRQNPRESVEVSEEPEEQAAEKKKPRGRLPAYYSKVVTEQQRSDIYEIQARYSGMISDLQQRIDELTDRRGKEIESILSASQVEQLQKLKADAKARRRSARNDSEKESSERQ